MPRGRRAGAWPRSPTRGRRRATPPPSSIPCSLRLTAVTCCLRLAGCVTIFTRGDRHRFPLGRRRRHRGGRRCSRGAHGRRRGHHRIVASCSDGVISVGVGRSGGEGCRGPAAPRSRPRAPRAIRGPRSPRPGRRRPCASLPTFSMFPKCHLLMTQNPGCLSRLLPAPTKGGEEGRANQRKERRKVQMLCAPVG